MQGKILWPQLSGSDVYFLGPFPQGGRPVNLDFLKQPKSKLFLPHGSLTLLGVTSIYGAPFIARHCISLWGYSDRRRASALKQLTV